MSPISKVVTDSFSNSDTDRILEQVEADEISINDAVDELLPKLNGDIQQRWEAGYGIAMMAVEDRTQVGDHYPETVEELLDTKKALVMAQSGLHEVVALQQKGITAETFLHGVGTTGRLVEEILDEEIEIDDNLGESVPGGGAAYVYLASEIRDRSFSIEGREQVVVEAFADVIEAVAEHKAREMGMDPIDTLVDLRSRNEVTEGMLLEGIAAGQIQETTDTREIPVERPRNRIIVALVAVLLVGVVEQDISSVLRIEAAIAERI